ncbi:pqn-48 [Pristionchus pacificus]|nr:pqn-48 [Pristionchus pacificus]
MRLLLLLTAFCIKVYSQQRSSAQPTPFYESRTLQQSSATVPQQATVSRQYPSIAPPVTAYHTAAAGVPAATNIQQHQTQQQRTRNPYPTQMSYRAPQRKSTPRGHAQSNHVPILTKASPTRIVATVSPVELARQQQLKAEQERRRAEDQHRKHAEKQRLENERRRQAEEKKRTEQERKHREAIEAAERQRVEQARIKAEEERKRADEENKRRTDEELRRKAAENERLRQHHAAQAAVQREQHPHRLIVAPLQSVVSQPIVHPTQQQSQPTVHQQLSHNHQTTHMQAHPVQVIDPRNHYNSVPLAAPIISHQAFNDCDMPPDLWCDSRESAAACGVEQQCQRLRRKPIKITLIYEALCPFCQRFISNQLGIVFNSLRGHFELELVPWGNSRLLPDGSFSCNHGQKECDANRLQSCVLDQLQVKGALPFIVCFEKNIFSQTVEASWRACTAFVRSHEREIRHCYDSEKGVQLQRIAAQKTFSARPQPIVEVPYLLINDYSPTTENNDLNVMLFPQLLGKWAKIYNRK